MKFRFRAFICLLSTFLFFSCSSKESAKIDLGSGWQYSTVNPDRDDCEFKLLPDESLTHLKDLVPNNTETIYLKKDFIVPLQLQKEDVSIYLGYIADSDKTYLNHYLIGNTTNSTSGSFSFFNVPRFYDIAEELLVPGVNTLIVEIEINHNGFLKGNGFISFSNEARRAYTKERFFSELIYFAFAVILIFISLFLIKEIVKFYNKSEILFFCIISLLTSVNLSYFFITEIPFVLIDKINYQFYLIIFNFALPAVIALLFILFVIWFIKKNQDYSFKMICSVMTVPVFIVLDLFFQIGLKFTFIPVISYYSFPLCLIFIFFVLISKKLKELKPLKTTEDLKYIRILPKIIDTENFQVAYFFKPSRGIKELMYDIFTEDNRLSGIALFEAAKNDLNSTNLIMHAKQIVGKTFNENRKISLPKVMEKINLKSEENNTSSNLLYGSLLRFSDSRVEYVNSTHTTAFYRVSKTGISVPVKLKNGDSLLSGIGFSMSSGDALILYSKTFENSQNPENEPFSALRIQTAFKQSGSGTALTRLEYILNMFQNYTNGVPNNRDLTVLIVQKK